MQLSKYRGNEAATKWVEAIFGIHLCKRKKKKNPQKLNHVTTQLEANNEKKVLIKLIAIGVLMKCRHLLSRITVEPFQNCILSSKTSENT